MSSSQVSLVRSVSSVRRALALALLRLFAHRRRFLLMSSGCFHPLLRFLRPAFVTIALAPSVAYNHEESYTSFHACQAWNFYGTALLNHGSWLRSRRPMYT